MANPNIFAQFAAPRSIADYQGDARKREAEVLTLEEKRRSNAMSDMTFRQSQAKQNALMQIASGWTPKTTAQERIASLRSNPLTFGEADALEKSDLDRQKTTAEVGDKNAGTAEKLMKIRKAAIGMVVANPTPEALEAVMADLEAVTGVPAAQGRALFQGATTPEAIKERAMRIGLELDKQMPQLSTQNLGGNMASVSRDPLSGAVTTNALTPITQSADNAATQATSIENNKRSTGATLAVAGAARDQAAATRDAARITADSKRQQDTEMKLADDYRTESKGWAETSTAMKKVLVALKTATTNAGSALAAGTGFMKILDPNSVVRESELGMALNASGWFDRAMNVAQKLQSGTVMTKTQQANLEAAARDLFKEAKAAQLEVDKAYETRAKSYGVNPRNIITDRGQNTPDEPAAAKDQPANGWGAVKVN